jgi:uncharacterized protein (TIGR03067 family)
MKKVLALLALPLVGLLVATDTSKADDATEELKKLAGTWTLVSEVADGEERDADYIKKIKWIINEDGTWKVLEDGKVKYRGKLAVDPAKRPKTIDSTLAGDQEGTVVRSIYELKEDSLKHCFAVDKDRPKAFESKSGSGHINSVFKRMNKE